MTTDLLDRIARLEAALEMAQHQLEAQQHVLTWLLAQNPKHNVRDFLQRWALECEGNQRLEEDVALISALNEDLQQLYV